MNFTDIKTLTIIGNNVSIDGIDKTITSSLDESIDAVQYHKGRDYLLEEPLMTQVPFERYQYALDQYEAVIEEILEVEIDIAAELENAIQNMLDTKAKEMRYDSIDTIAKYLGFDNPFRAECEALALWCANCWTKARDIESAVINGDIAQPTKEQILAEMPTFTL